MGVGGNLTRQDGPFPQSPADEVVLNLGLGQPSPALLPLQAIDEAARERLGPGNDPLVLQYGAVQGYAGFRESLAAFLRSETGVDVRAEALAVTGGISLGLGMVSQVFGRPGDRIVCGDPTYFLARGIFETAGLQPLGIPVDEHGLDVEALARSLRGGLRIAFAYVIPSFHNPCGVTLDVGRAEQLVDLAERHDFLIVADEPYPMLHFGERPPSMMSYDQGRCRVISLGSFSKILGPGLRLGWMHAQPPLIDRFLQHGVLQSGGGLAPVVSSIVHDTLESGFLARHVEASRTRLASRARALMAALDARLPELRYAPPGGGYFVWGRLPDPIDTTDLLESSRTTHRVGFTPGRRCAVDRDLSAYLRLSFAFYDETELEDAVDRLARAVAALSNEPR